MEYSSNSMNLETRKEKLNWKCNVSFYLSRTISIVSNQVWKEEDFILRSILRDSLGEDLLVKVTRRRSFINGGEGEK